MRSSRQRGLTSDLPDWLSFDRYFATDDAARLELDHLIEQDTTAVRFRSPRVAMLRGRLVCVSGLSLQFDVVFNRRPANMLRVRRYTSHAGIMRQVDHPIFRYDNAPTMNVKGILTSATNMGSML